MVAVVLITTVVTNIFMMFGSMFSVSTESDFLITRFNVTAVRTALSGWVETVRYNKRFSKLFSLVFHKLSEATKKRTMKVFGLLFHLYAFYIQILNHDSIIPAIQVGGKLVKHVILNIANSFIGCLQLGSRCVIPFRMSVVLIDFAFPCELPLIGTNFGVQTV